MWIDPKEYLIGSFYAKTFSGAVVQFVDNMIDLFFSYLGKVTILWEVLSDKAIRILI